MKDLKKDIHKIKSKFPYIKFSSPRDQVIFMNIYNILEASDGPIDNKILLSAFASRNDVQLNTSNDYYYLVTKALAENKTLVKTAYPFGMGSDSPISEVDLNVWSKLVHKIYDAIHKGDMTFDNALDYYSGFLDERTGEDQRFKKWIMYYKNGENKKYSSEGDNMKKDANFQFSLGNTDFYDNDTREYDESMHDRVDKMMKNETGKKTDEFESWKGKLHGAIRRIDKLLRMDRFLKPDEQQELADLLHVFDSEVRRVRLSSTGADLTYRLADSFNKKGYKIGYNELIKVAQELADREPLDEAPEPSPIAQPEGDMAAPPTAAVPEISEEGIEAPAELPEQQPEASRDQASEVIGRALESGEKPIESGTAYDELNPEQGGGALDLGQAMNKLEEVAARLADRRTIRQLAEFDIMLDKIGLASMFPELAEAQSKLIDAYSYALVRVTKMLGMLASGKTLSEIETIKKKDISNRAIKDVNKTINQEQLGIEDVAPEEPAAQGEAEKTKAIESGMAAQEESAPKPIE